VGKDGEVRVNPLVGKSCRAWAPALVGTAILLVCSSAAMARTHIGDVVSHEKVAPRAAVAGPTIVGTASTYDPFRPGYRSGGVGTASGEPYNRSAWAAAIKTPLRGRFGGVRPGVRRYALVESAGKKAIIEINDVGPLEPGRIIDFNTRTMRYFDPSLERGLIPAVKVTPLSGDHWTAGPVAEN
jgi:rare lipoprotein A